MVTDTISDLLTRIRNAQKAGHKSVRVPVCNTSGRILDVLKKEGFVNYVERKKDRNDKFEEFEVGIKYLSSGEPLISRLERVSKPGRRVYKGVKDLPKIHCGLGIAIVSTSQGVLSDREARQLKIGGEILAFIS
jgi:small subunit ribosomal protein S8